MSNQSIRQSDLLDLHRSLSSNVMGLNLIDAYSPLPEIFSQDILQSIKNQGSGAEQFLLLLTRRLNQLLERSRQREKILAPTKQTNNRAETVKQICEAKYGYSQNLNITTFYSGLFPTGVKSSAGIKKVVEHLLSNHLESIHVKEHLGSWMQIPERQRSRLGNPAQYHCLGVDAIVGKSQWNYEQELLFELVIKKEIEKQEWQSVKAKVLTIKKMIKAFVGDAIEVKFKAKIPQSLCHKVQLKKWADKSNETDNGLGNSHWLGKLNEQNTIVI